MEVQTTLLQSVRALALLSLIEQVTEQHNSTTMFTTSIHQPKICPSTIKLNFSGSQSLLAPPNHTGPCQLKTVRLKILKSDDHYCMGLLWKRDAPDLPFNCRMAEICFCSPSPEVMPRKG